MIEETLFNQDAERSLIGAIIINPVLYSTIDLQPEEFFIERHGIIWKAIGNLYLKDLSIDYLTIIDELTRMDCLGKIGGEVYIAELASQTPSSLHGESYAFTIRDYSRRRNLIQVASKIAMMAHDKDSKIEDELTKIIDDITKNVARPDGATHWEKYLLELQLDIIDRKENPKSIWGIPTGYPRFDKITGGIQQSEMLLFSGKPGVGKSIWVMQAAEQMASNSPGAIYSVEMPGIQTIRRTLSSKSLIETFKMKSGKINDQEMESINKAIKILSGLPIFMSDSSDWSTSALRADLQRLKIRHGIKWFIFDYMMLANDGRGLGLVDRTMMLSRSFKLICRQLDLAGIVIHSMRKSGIEQSNPEQQELFGAAQSVYDADLICFLNEFIPMTYEDQSISPEEKKNIKTLTFGKGRELEESKKYIHMVKRPGFPVFGDLERE